MSDGIWLITSGAYVDEEMSAEFGHLPPVFLPVGTKRLYEYQIEKLGGVNPLYITLPESYDLASEDQQRFRDLGVTALPVPDGLNLGDSIVFALNLIGGADQPVHIIHGDTLIDDVPAAGKDAIGIAAGGAGYSWAEATLQNNQVTELETVVAGAPSDQQRFVACGYFAFCHSHALIRGIVRSRGDFIKGILSYADEFPLTAMHIESWLDFGHLQTFYRSRRKLASARAFNTLRIDERIARKLSDDTFKMEAEAAWFANVPPTLRVYTARLIDAGREDARSFYETEYEYLPTVSELFVFGTLGRVAWMQILQSCHEFLEACALASGEVEANSALSLLATVKTRDRLKTFSDRTGFDVDAVMHYDGRSAPSLMQIADDLPKYLMLYAQKKSVIMHGDFCFSNILYSSRVQRIRVIDPRGYIEPGQKTIYGDTRYDLAKLSHSIVGRYDQIIAGRYNMAAADGQRYSIEFEKRPHHAWLEDAWKDFKVAGVAAWSSEIRALTIGLFLSMLPLHADRPDRQRAFIANALRLYVELEVDRT